MCIPKTDIKIKTLEYKVLIRGLFFYLKMIYSFLLVVFILGLKQFFSKDCSPKQIEYNLFYGPIARSEYSGRWSISF